MMEVAGHRKVPVSDMEFEARRVSRIRLLLEISAPIRAGVAPNRIEIGHSVQEVQLYAGS